MKKIIFWILAVAAILILAFFLLNSYIYNEKQAEEEVADLGVYFQDRMINLGIEKIGHPIEGFDNNLLITAFPGLQASDFNGVETFEGYYEVRGEETLFIRYKEQPVSSAERTISKKGYSTLLENVSARLGFPVKNEAGVDELIEKINTGESVKVGLGEEVSMLDVKIIPQEILEDSRCPTDATCIWAGTVKLRATLESGLGTADQIFELQKTITTEAEEVTLVNVYPAAKTGIKITDDQYLFEFKVQKR